MNCEEFETVGLDAARGKVSARDFIAGRGAREAEQAVALEHANACSRCAALLETWQSARQELRALAELTEAEQAPQRVEMRLRQEFRLEHRRRSKERVVLVAAWALSAAMVLFGISAWNKRIRTTPSRMPENAATNTPVVLAPDPGGAAAGPGGSAELASRGALGAAPKHARKPRQTVQQVSSATGTFALLPGSLPMGTEDSSIVRVRLQRASLAALGLPMNEERAGEWVQVDFLVGADGQPQAVRLPGASDASPASTSW